MQHLHEWWNTGVMISEFVSALFLTLFVALTNFFFGKMMNNNKFVKWFIVPILYAVDGMLAIYFGILSGNAYKDGEGYALMSVPFTLIKAIYSNAFNLVPAAIAFQTIGSIVGILIYMAIAKVSRKVRIDKEVEVKDGLIIPQIDSQVWYLKEFAAQILFVIGLMFITTIDYGMDIQSNIYMGVFVNTIYLTFIFALFTKYFYFMLSPQLILANLLAGMYYKVVSLKNWVALAVNAIGQISVVLMFSYPEYAIRNN